MSSHAPTKRELREQRRADRLAAEQAAAAKAARRRRGWHPRRRGRPRRGRRRRSPSPLTSSSDKPAAATPRRARHRSLFAGIPEHNGVLGDPKAPSPSPSTSTCSARSAPRRPHDRCRRSSRLRQDRQGQAPGAHAALHRPGLGPRRQGRRRRRAAGPAVAVPGDVLRQPGRGELRLRDRRLPAPGRGGRGRERGGRARPGRQRVRAGRASTRANADARSSASTRRRRSRSRAATGRPAWSARP